jgi:DNA-binding MarR family transcriptional regulator
MGGTAGFGVKAFTIDTLLTGRALVKRAPRDYLRRMTDAARIPGTESAERPAGVPDAAPPAIEAAEQLVHLARLVHGGAREDGLTPAQWTALRYFARANRFSRTPSAFSEFHATTRGTASQTVKSLVALGLLERRPNEQDGRSALIEVTEAGHARLAEDPLDALGALIAAMPAAERRAFSAALTRLTGAMARLRASPVFGNCVDCGHCDTSLAGPAYCRCTQTLLVESEMRGLCADFAPAAPR